MDLTKRVILITGAGRRVGRAIALRLAQSGAHLAIHCHRSTADAGHTADDCRALGVTAEIFCADLADPAATAGLIRAVQARFGQLDVLINNASIFEPMNIEQFDLTHWENTLRINLTAPMILTHTARDLLRTAHGRIINLLDTATSRPWPDHLAYITSKGALETLTKALARALAPEVNVTGVAPGIAQWPAHYDQQTRQRLTARVPLQRPGTPEDIAAAVHYLLRDGDYITGTILTVDGGRHIV